MISADRAWYSFPGATQREIVALRNRCPPGLPDAYFKLLAFSNGGEGPLPVAPFNFVLDSTTQVLDEVWMRDNGLEGLFAFGGTGGGELVALDMRAGQAPWPVVSVDMIAGLSSLCLIATDFDAFLELIGIYTN